MSIILLREHIRELIYFALCEANGTTGTTGTTATSGTKPATSTGGDDKKDEKDDKVNPKVKQTVSAFEKSPILGKAVRSIGRGPMQSKNIVNTEDALGQAIKQGMEDNGVPNSMNARKIFNLKKQKNQKELEEELAAEKERKEKEKLEKQGKSSTDVDKAREDSFNVVTGKKQLGK